MINLSHHLLNFADEVEDNIKEKYYDLLKVVLNRGEFDLYEMGFAQENIPCLNKFKNYKIIQDSQQQQENNI